MTDLTTLATAAQAHATLAHSLAREGNLNRAQVHRAQAITYLDDVARVIAEADALAQLDDRVHPEGAPAEARPPADPTACTCRCLRPATHLEPAEWEQDPDCPVHPMAPPPTGPAWARRWLYTEGPFLMLTHEHAQTLVDVVVRLRQSASYATLITDLDTIAAANIPGIDGSAESTIVDQVLDAARNLTDASLMVATERRRQIDVEGYRPEHDLAHQPGELAAAAGCYLLAADSPHGDQLPVPGAWPWAPEHWKPSDSRSRNLTKAAALVVAELDAELARERLIAEEDAQLAGAESDARQAEDAQGRAEHDAAQHEPPPDPGYQGEEPF